MTPPGKDSGRAQILVVEDSSVFREMQGLLLRQAGFVAWLFENPQVALVEAAKTPFDLVVIDYELPEMNGEQFMHALRKLQPDIAVVFVSGSLTLELAIQLSRQGVAGIFNKPANPKALLEKINETLSRAARDTAVRAGSVSPLPGSRTNGNGGAHALPVSEPSPGQLAYEPRYVLGASDAFREFTHRLWRVRDFRAVLLLQGEAGSPFELLARELAGVSVFRDGPVMRCDAATFEPRHLIEVLAPSLLSHDAGTLIVTGIEDFTAGQQKTLENLTTGRDVFLPFARRFRLVLTATARLSERVEAGDFDENLYYKISSLTVPLLALREMRADIVANSLHLLAQHHDTVDANAPTALHPDAAAWLEQQDWPGNYEQLEKVLKAALREARGPELTLGALEAAAAAQPAPVTAPVAPPAPPPVVAAPVVAAPPAIAAPAVSVAPARPATPVVATRSLFRPTSSSYNFAKRLAESIAVAEACGAT